MVAKRSRKARAGAEPAGFDSSTFLHFHARVADGEANGLQSRDSRFESAPWCHRRARQMVSQHTANVPSVHARLGSIPRLSAKVRVSGGYGWARLPVEQSAPANRHRELRERSGVRACTEASPGTIRGHRLFRT